MRVQTPGDRADIEHETHPKASGETGFRPHPAGAGAEDSGTRLAGLRAVTSVM